MPIPKLELVAQTLTDALDLTYTPVAIAILDAVPSGMALYEGVVPAGCRFWQEATRRVFATTPRDHALCAIGVYTHHLEVADDVRVDLDDALKIFGGLGYVRPEDIPLIPVLESSPKVVVYGPLASMPVEPDLVLLFVQSEQTLILSEASQQFENGLPPALGRPACSLVPQALNSGRTALSLGCCGARAYLDVLTPDMALYAVPARHLEGFTERVTVLAKANAVLTRFHELRGKDIESGARPSVRESLSLMNRSGGRDVD
jgi:uncharacterized protein (DUF169 family)